MAALRISLLLTTNSERISNFKNNLCDETLRKTQPFLRLFELCSTTGITTTISSFKPASHRSNFICLDGSSKSIAWGTSKILP